MLEVEPSSQHACKNSHWNIWHTAAAVKRQISKIIVIILFTRNTNTFT